MTTSVKHLYEFGPFQLDPPERLLICDGHPVPMTPKAFDMVVVLVERGGHLVEKEDLLKAVWPGSFVEEGNLAVTVSVLRKALNDDRGLHRYIETVSKRGYRFVAEVREIGEPPRALSLAQSVDSLANVQDGGAAKAEIVVASNTSGKRVQWKIFATAVLGLMALFVLFRAIPRRRVGTSEENAAMTIHSLAVLPFQTLGAKQSDQYLGLGMADAVITGLGNTGKVLGRPTSSI